MNNGRYFYSERVLIWFDPDADILAVNIFDIHRSELDSLPSVEPEHLVEAGDHEGSKPMWSKTIKTPARFTLSMFTNEPPVEESTP